MKSINSEEDVRGNLKDLKRIVDDSAAFYLTVKEFGSGAVWRPQVKSLVLLCLVLGSYCARRDGSGQTIISGVSAVPGLSMGSPKHESALYAASENPSNSFLIRDTEAGYRRLSIGSASQWFSSNDFSHIASRVSCQISPISMTSPMATNAVQPSRQTKYTSLRFFKHALHASSQPQALRTSSINSYSKCIDQDKDRLSRITAYLSTLLRFLEFVGIAIASYIILGVLECTIGIKQRIKNLFVELSIKRHGG